MARTRGFKYCLTRTTSRHLHPQPQSETQPNTPPLIVPSIEDTESSGISELSTISERASDGTVMESFERIYLDLSKQPGKCRIAETGLGWKPSGGGDTFTLDANNIGNAQWSRAAKGFELKIFSRTNEVIQLDGFEQEVRFQSQSSCRPPSRGEAFVNWTTANMKRMIGLRSYKQGIQTLLRHYTHSYRTCSSRLELGKRRAGERRTCVQCSESPSIRDPL